MSPFSQCRTAERTPATLPIAGTVKLMVALALVLAFGLVHINLRLRLDAIKRDISSLQNDQGRLLSEINEVRTVNESLKTTRNLQAYAKQDLGMVAYNPSERAVLSVPREIETRYAMARATGDRMVADSTPGLEDNPWLMKVGERIGLMGEANAAEPHASR